MGERVETSHVKLIGFLNENDFVCHWIRCLFILSALCYFRFCSMREKDIENQILDYLTKSDLGFFWKCNIIGVFDPVRKVYRKPKNKYLINGVSDILGVRSDGIFCAIEVKTPKTKKNVSEAQKRFLDNVLDNGGRAGVAWDVESALVIVTGDLLQ